MIESSCRDSRLPLHTLILLNNAQAQWDNRRQREKEREGVTCENVVDLLHRKVGVLCSEAQGGLKFQHIAMRSVSTEKDVLFL